MNQRRADLLKAVTDTALTGQALTIPDICRIAGVSPATAYKDVQALTKMRVSLDRGVIRLEDEEPSTVLPERFGFRTAVKTKLATEIVRKVIPLGCVLYLDTGTTCYSIARELVEQQRSDVTVVTPNPFALGLLASRGTVRELVCLGGVVRSEAASLHGPLTVTGIAYLKFDLALISVDFIHSDADASLATFSAAETEQKRAACEQAADSVCVVADDSKLGRNLGIVFTSISTIAASKQATLAIGTEEGGLPPEISTALARAAGSRGRVLVARASDAANDSGN